MLHFWLTKNGCTSENIFILNTCVERRDKVQLVMELPAVLSNGEVRNLKVLIDTGAQANLVRKGLISSHLFYGAPRILKLIAANGQRIEGGDRVVDVHLQFCCERDGKMLEHMIEYPCTFHEAGSNKGRRNFVVPLVTRARSRRFPPQKGSRN